MSMYEGIDKVKKLDLPEMTSDCRKQAIAFVEAASAFTQEEILLDQVAQKFLEIPVDFVPFAYNVYSLRYKASYNPTKAAVRSSNVRWWLSRLYKQLGSTYTKKRLCASSWCLAPCNGSTRSLRYPPF